VFLCLPKVRPLAANAIASVGKQGAMRHIKMALMRRSREGGSPTRPRSWIAAFVAMTAFDILKGEKLDCRLRGNDRI